MEYYAERVVNLFDPDFFETAENIAIFERLTLGKAPTLEKIEHLKDRQGNI